MRWTGSGQDASEAFLYVPAEARERCSWESLRLASRGHSAEWTSLPTVAAVGKRAPTRGHGTHGIAQGGRMSHEALHAGT